MTHQDEQAPSHQQMAAALETLKTASLGSCDALALGLASLPLHGIAAFIEREPAYLACVLTIAEEIYAQALAIGAEIDAGGVATDRSGALVPAARAVVEEALRRIASDPNRNSVSLPEPGTGGPQWVDCRRELAEQTW